MEMMGETRSQLLFALQHEPGSETAPYHKHSVERYTDQIERNIQETTNIWRSYIATDMTPEEAVLAEELLASGISISTRA